MKVELESKIKKKSVSIIHCIVYLQLDLQFKIKGPKLIIKCN